MIKRIGGSWSRVVDIINWDGAIIGGVVLLSQVGNRRNLGPERVGGGGGARVLRRVCSSKVIVGDDDIAWQVIDHVVVVGGGGGVVEVVELAAMIMRGGGSGDVGGCGVGGGGLNPLDEPRHPQVAHGVLELLAVHVTFQLLGVLLDPGSPVVLDLVVRSPRQVLRNFGPSVSPARMKLKNEKLFFKSDVSTSNIGAKIVQPPQSTALSCPFQAGAASERIPATFAVISNVIDESEVFLNSPWPSSQVHHHLFLITT